MIIESEGSIYILSKNYTVQQPNGVVCYGRIRRQDLLDLGDKENDARVIYHGRVLDFSKDTIFRDEVVPEIERDSYLEYLSNNINDYRGRHIIRVIDLALQN